MTDGVVSDLTRRNKSIYSFAHIFSRILGSTAASRGAVENGDWDVCGMVWACIPGIIAEACTVHG
jgi:hypothetical protein